MSWLDSIIGRVFKSNEHLIRVNQALLERLESAFMVPKEPLGIVVGASLTSHHLNRILSAYAGLSIPKVHMDDTLYDIPHTTFVWEQLYQWLFPILSERYKQPNRGTDCEDLANRAEQFFRHFWVGLDSLAIGTAVVKLPQGTRHATSVVLWTDANQDIKMGFLEFSPQSVFHEPPPLGLFTLEQTKWALEEITI